MALGLLERIVNMEFMLDLITEANSEPKEVKSCLSNGSHLGILPRSNSMYTSVLQQQS